MSYRSLQSFIKELEKEGEIVRIKEEVNAYLEITEITERVSKSFGPALLFEKVKGSDYPVLINAMGTYKRIGMALGLKDFKELDQELEKFVDTHYHMTTMNSKKSTFSLGRLGEVFSMKLPVKGHCQEVINEHPDLRKLPIIHCWPEDEAPSMVTTVMMNLDSKLGTQHVSTYHMQVLDKKTIRLHWDWYKEGDELYEIYKKRGGRIPVSIVLGGDLAITYAASATLPKWLDKMSLAAYLSKTPIKMVKSITNDIYVPSEAEFIIEGYVDINEPLQNVGIFGNEAGFYTAEGTYPVLHVTCITHKKEPVYPTVIESKSLMEAKAIRKATGRALLPVIKMLNPEVVDIDFPLEGTFYGCVILSIKKSLLGQAKKVLNMVWGMEQMMQSKIVIVVDEDIHPNDYEAVTTRILECVIPKEDIIFSPGPLHHLDYASSVAGYGYRLGIDATKKIFGKEPMQQWHQLEQLQKENFEVQEALNGIIREMIVIREGVFKGYTIAAIRKNDPQDINRVCQFYWDQAQIQSKCFMIVDEKIDIRNASAVLWEICSHMDTQRDVLRIADEEGEVKVIIDATQKGPEDGHYREWPEQVEMTPSIKELVTQKWETYGI